MNPEIDWDEETAKARLISHKEGLDRKAKEDSWYNGRIVIAKKYLDSFGCEDILQSLRNKKLKMGEVKSGSIRKSEMERVAGYEYYIYLQWPEFKQGDHQWHDEYYEGHRRWFDDDRF